MHRIFKLDETTDNSGPAHFNSLVENLILERTKINKQVKNETLNCLKLELELIYCVALTVALEIGFRLEKTEYSTNGFDIRAMKELTSLITSRDLKNLCLKTILHLPDLNIWHFKLVSSTLCEELALLNIVAINEDKIMSTSSLIIPWSKYLLTSNKGLEMFQDIKTLSMIFTKHFYTIICDVQQIAETNNCSIFSLPDELKRIIFLKLRFKDFVNLCETSKILWNFINDEIIWKHFLLRDFAITLREGSSYHTYRAMKEHGFTIRISSGQQYPSRDSVYSDMSLELIDLGHFL